MDFIPFNDLKHSRSTPKSGDNHIQNVGANSARMKTQKPAFGSPAVVAAFGSPAVQFGSPALHCSGGSYNKTPSPRHFQQNHGGCANHKSPKPYNNFSPYPYHQQNGFRDKSPRSPNTNYSKGGQHHKSHFTPRALIQDAAPMDVGGFKAPQHSPGGRSRGMGRKSMTWTYGQVKAVILSHIDKGFTFYYEISLAYYNNEFA